MSTKNSTKKRAAKKIGVDYKNGKIYKIVNDVNDIVYIGSTASSLTKRFSCHKSKSRTMTCRFYAAMKEIGADHFRIILIELFPCTCKAELEAREYAVTNTFDKAILYNTMMNGKVAPETKIKLAAAKFNRGSIGWFNHHGSTGFTFQWKENRKQMHKTFSYPMKRTKEAAYMLCVAARDEIYPLTNKDYLEELPFAN